MILTRRDMVLGVGALALSGCSVPQMTIPPDISDIPVARRRDLLVVTNRRVSAAQGLEFDSLRSDRMFYCDYGISVPPDRKPGEFSFPRSTLDPDRQFFVTQSTHFPDERGFLNRLNARLRTLPKGERNVVLFVHGYNVSYPGAVFRAAQIATDFDLGQPMVLFSWPSAGRLSRYAYDRDSVLYARTALAETLRMLCKSHAENIMVLAHSMGGLLAMEALKRLALQGDRRTLSRLIGVALVQPDIDVDLFRRQVVDLRPYDVDLAVFASRRDRALKISAVLTGGHPRVGEAENIEDLRRLGVVVIDTSGAPMGDPLGHAALMRSPALLSMIASEELVDRIVSGAPGQDILIEGLSLTGKAALAIAYLPYTITGS
ncbi:alpha/beta hydrolase [Celeribacter persicus]|uniref:Esterase/lipase superfamily enzyme n=1 Tax=Celeribacter persicus TaxID=1651082 RepID=A0A2T5HM42_9RHOB|nr:alpha/beta fold hydrolase [Celeribacter persicus]PTQ72619.1 esterase/lipase superfamily enzyme [Celeribacter persicus]